MPLGMNSLTKPVAFSAQPPSSMARSMALCAHTTMRCAGTLLPSSSSKVTSL